MDVEDTLERLGLEEYGVGIPFSLFFGGVVVFWMAFPGLKMFDSLTVYGKFGLVIILLVCISLIAAAGYTYNEIEVTWWMMTEDDAPDLSDSDSGVKSEGAD